MARDWRKAKLVVASEIDGLVVSEINGLDVYDSTVLRVGTPGGSRGSACPFHVHVRVSNAPAAFDKFSEIFGTET